MNTSHYSHQAQLKQLLPLMRFYDVVTLAENIYYDDLLQIAKNAGVSKVIIDNMYTHVAIRRVDAEKVLAAFSEYTGHPWTLERCVVALLPTFADICKEHNLDFPQLAALDISLSTLDRMLTSVPVSMGDASLVLTAISQMAGKWYTLENVDIVLADTK